MQVKYSYSKYTGAAPHTNTEVDLGADKQHLRPEVQRRLDELTDMLTIDCISISGSQQSLMSTTSTKRRFKVGAIIRMPWTGPTPESSRGFRVWCVECECLGGLGQESVYGLVPLDEQAPNDQDGKVTAVMYVPVLLLETHPGIEVVG